jgi:hypothetical protein
LFSALPPIISLGGPVVSASIARFTKVFSTYMIRPLGPLLAHDTLAPPPDVERFLEIIMPSQSQSIASKTKLRDRPIRRDTGFVNALHFTALDKVIL